MTAPLRACTTCEAPIPVGALYCRACGTSIPTDTGRIAPNADGETGDAQIQKSDLERALGRGFEVRQRVGRGGFGEVWSAFDKQLDRAVAVKVLRPELSASGEFKERFRREARAVAQLRHPGIVPIYHVGEAQGMVYFVMPLVEGITLTMAMRQEGGLAANEAVRILIEAAGALREAHSHGIVHRDLKPENFMLEGPQRRVLLMDFGIAKVDGKGAEGLTETGIVLGSPEYMSPEQATGRALDARSDIYSLGVVAYKMLSGKLPFDAETAHEVLAHHVLTPPEPLEDKVDLPAGLTDAVMRCLAKNPDDRWPSAEALLEEISGAAPLPPGPAPTRAERKVVAPPAPVAAPPVQLSRRRWLPVAGIAILVALVALAAMTPGMMQRARRVKAWTAAAAGAGVLYRESADSLLVASRAFLRGDTTGADYLAAQEALLLLAESRIEEAFGPALDDSAQWPESARQVLRAAAQHYATASLDASHRTVAASEIAGCRLLVTTDSIVAYDAVSGDNCWWRSAGAMQFASPVEYLTDFRVAGPLRPDAGLGLAWCTRAADCRVVFLWSASAMVWASHLPQTGLQALQAGRRVPLNVGDYRLRVREQDGMVRVWLNGRVVLEREVGRESAYLERPSSVHLVVQNATIRFTGSEPLGVVGVRRQGFE